MSILTMMNWPSNALLEGPLGLGVGKARAFRERRAAKRTNRARTRGPTKGTQRNPAGRGMPHRRAARHNRAVFHSHDARHHIDCAAGRSTPRDPLPRARPRWAARSSLRAPVSDARVELRRRLVTHRPSPAAVTRRRTRTSTRDRSSPVRIRRCAYAPIGRSSSDSNGGPFSATPCSVTSSMARGDGPRGRRVVPAPVPRVRPGVVAPAAGSMLVPRSCCHKSSHPAAAAACSMVAVAALAPPITPGMPAPGWVGTDEIEVARITSSRLWGTEPASCDNNRSRLKAEPKCANRSDWKWAGE